MISVICVYNNKKILDDYLLKSLDLQNVDYELILIKNTNQKFKSAAEALNYGGKKAEGNLLMFVHQDFELEIDSLELIDQYLNSLENVGIAGVAGKYNKQLVSKIRTGVPPELPGEIAFEKPLKVQTLDECITIIPQSIFKKIQFDEITCDNWHLYATDYCLSVKSWGYDVYVIPLEGYHVSPGYSFSGDLYYSTLKKLVKKHKGNYKWIYTTTGSWSTVYPLFMQIFYQKLYYFLLQFKILVKFKKKISP
ncbi:glycosyltransferase [Methanobacterium movens]